MNEQNWKNRTLFHGDNLDFLRAMNSESVDLIATDPPFNKGKEFYATPASLASGASFQDRWSWKDDVQEEWIDQITDDHPRVMNVVQGSRFSYGDDMGAFLCFMAVRLLAMRRVLKDTGSIYLHCDPTASHYLKELMDAVFGRKNFQNEVIWHYKSFHGNVRRYFPKKHDVLLVYNKDREWTFNRLFEEDNTGTIDYARWQSFLVDGKRILGRNMPVNDSRFVRFLNRWRRANEGREPAPNDVVYEVKGQALDTVWDIKPVDPKDKKERYGYPTQKPLALYERIIKASSNEGDVVLDPFCGCATTLVAAERLNRSWVGIDIWDEAHDAVVHRLQEEGLAAPDGSTGGVALALFGKIHYSKELPERTDDGETATVALETIHRKELAAWQKLSHKDMVAILKEAQADTDDEKLVVCAGCGRKLEPEFMELDHIMPKSELHSTNDLSNRIMLCRPCNGRKSNKLSMSGLRNENKKDGWVANEDLAKWAVTMAFNAYQKVQRQDS